MRITVCPFFATEDVPSGYSLQMVINGNDDTAFAWGCSCGSRAQVVVAGHLGCWDDRHHGCVRLSYLDLRAETMIAVYSQVRALLNPPMPSQLRRLLDRV